MKTFKILISVLFLIASFLTYSQEHKEFKFNQFGGSRGIMQTVQLSDNGITASDIVRTILPQGTPISNVTFTGPQGLGYFTGGIDANFPLDEGALFSSGCLAELTQGGLLCDNMGLPGDNDLNNLGVNYLSNDAAFLEFDFVPDFSTLSFNVIYGSAEASNYYVEPSGIFLDGTNIAFVPQTNDAISNLTLWNTPYYHINQDFSSVLYQYSDVIAVSASLTPNITHHLKIAISDTDDQVVPSYLFVEGIVDIEAVPVAWWSVVLAMGLILGFVAFRFFAIHRG